MLFTPHLKQAWINLVVLPAAHLVRESGLIITTSIFPAPLFETAEEVEYYRLWHHKKPLTSHAIAKGVLVDPALNIWDTHIYNTVSATDETPVNNLSFTYSEIDPMTTLEGFETLALREYRNLPSIEHQMYEKGKDAPEDHFLHIFYLSNQTGQGFEGEMMERRAHALMFGQDLSPNWNSNKSDGSILAPNRYHHFDAW